MRFYDFIKENVVGLPVPEDKTTTVRHLRNFFSSKDPNVISDNSALTQWSVKDHWFDILHNVSTDNFSAYSRISPHDHKRVLDDVTKEIQAKGGIIHRTLPARNDIDGRKTTTLEFVDKNSLFSHAVVRSYDNRHMGVGWRHEVHVTQNQGGRTSDVTNQ